MSLTPHMPSYKTIIKYHQAYSSNCAGQIVLSSYNGNCKLYFWPHTFTLYALYIYILFYIHITYIYIHIMF